MEIISQVSNEMYCYLDVRQKLLTVEGVQCLMAVRDLITPLLRQAHAFRADVLSVNWTVAACLDMLAEMNYISAIHELPSPALQDRIFVRGRRFPDEPRGS